MTTTTSHWAMIGALAFTSAACTGAAGTDPAPGGPTTQEASNPTDGLPGTDPSGPTGPATSGAPGAIPGDSNYEPLVPVPASMWRLTAAQYRNTIHDLFGIELSTDLEPDEQAELFLSQGAAKVGTSSRGVELYDGAAQRVVEQVFASPNTVPELANCTPASVADACVEGFIRGVGRKLFRRPLSEEEVTRYRAVVGASPNDASTGLRFALRGMLNSPNFLYVSQVGEPDPETGALRFTAHEMAARLSYVLLNSTPDDGLNTAADSGELSTALGVESEVRRLLGTERARDVAGRFFSESWSVSRLQESSKDKSAVPKWSAEVLDALREELHRTIEHTIFTENVDVRSLLTGTVGFINPLLADLYDVPSPGEGFHQIQLDARRSGLITSGAVMAANSPQGRTSPTLRGMFVLEKLLCIEAPPPPPNINTELAEGPDTSQLTTRERLELHRTDPVCGACHGLFDPLGMAFESYGAIGEYRSEESGKPIDSTGSFEGKDFSNIQELASFLREDERVGACITEKLYDFATARHASRGEAGVVAAINDQFAAANFNFQDLLVQVLTSRGFRLLAPPTP